jgi:hypothetical protein
MGLLPIYFSAKTNAQNTPPSTKDTAQIDGTTCISVASVCQSKHIWVA